MKFEKNNKYFTISVYVVTSILIVVLGAFLLINFKLIGGYIATFIKWLFSLLKPVIFGFIIAYLLDPLTDFYEKIIRRMTKKENIKRSYPTLLTLLTFLGIISLLIILIVINVRKVIGEGAVKDLQDSLLAYTEYFTKMISSMEGGSSFITQIYKSIDDFVNWLGSRSISILTDVGGNLLNIGLGFVIAFYGLKDKKLLLCIYNRFLNLIIPRNMQNEIRDIGRDIDDVFSGYIRGQIIDAVIMATLISVALMCIGIDFAIIIGIISGIFNLIPYFGPVVGFVLAGLIGLIGPSPIKGVYAVIAVMILQQIDGWFIVPKIMGKTVSLHPIAVLLAIVIGGQMFGLVGILLGVPVAGLIRLLVMRYMGDVFSMDEN